MGNQVKTLRLYKETVPAEVPANPTAYVFKAEGYNVKATQETEENVLLGQGRGATEKGYGVDTIAGDIPIIWGADNALPMVVHSIGEIVTTTGATAVAWTLSTVVAVGDMMNGVANAGYTYVCYTAGTTDATEFAITTEVRGDQITDGTAVWILMPTLYKHVGERGDCLSSFGVEVEDDNSCTAGTPAFSRYQGLYANTIGFSLTGDTKAIKTSVGTVGVKKEDSLLDVGYVDLQSTAGFSEVVLEDDFFTFDKCEFYLNGSLASQVTEFNISITNNVSMTNGFNGDKIDEIGQVAVSGNLKGLFALSLYQDANSHVDQSSRLEFTKANGTKLVIILPQYKMDKVDKMFETNKNIALDIPFGAYDKTTSKSITYEVISVLPTY